MDNPLLSELSILLYFAILLFQKQFTTKSLIHSYLVIEKGIITYYSS
jgi:hypothetical protein